MAGAASALPLASPAAARSVAGALRLPLFASLVKSDSTPDLAAQTVRQCYCHNTMLFK
jgi:hypothetical protein